MPLLIGVASPPKTFFILMLYQRTQKFLEADGNFMSLAHIRFVQESDNVTLAEYRVECPDMGENGQWQEVGKLRLEKALGKYDFIPGKVWVEKRALSPSLYGVSESEQKRLLSSDYDGMAWGTWAMIIHHYASSLLERKDYPLRYPEMMFADGKPR